MVRTVLAHLLRPMRQKHPGRRMTDVAVSVHVITDRHEAIARAVEVLGRALAGLALEGIDASLHVETLTDADVTEETP